MNTIFKLSKEYDNDGAAVTEINFSQLQKATAATYIKAYNIYTKKGYTEYPPEKTEEFAEILANLTTDLPIEFFDKLLVHDINGVVEFIRRILYGKPSTSEENENIIVLCRSIDVKKKTDSKAGKAMTVEKLDLSNIDTMTTLTLKRVNSIIRQRGIYFANNKHIDMRYALTVAEVLTGIEDLSSISIQDGIEIRNRVANFFILGR